MTCKPVVFPLEEDISILGHLPVVLEAPQTLQAHSQQLPQTLHFTAS